MWVRKNAAKFPQDFPAKSRKIHRRASGGAQGEYISRSYSAVMDVVMAEITVETFRVSLQFLNLWGICESSCALFTNSVVIQWWPVVESTRRDFSSIVTSHKSISFHRNIVWDVFC